MQPERKADVRRGRVEEASLPTYSATKVRARCVFVFSEIPHYTDLGAHYRVAIHGVLLARTYIIHMKTGTTLSGLVLLCALAVVTGVAIPNRPAHTLVGSHSSSEAAVLLLPGMGFVLLANRVRRPKRC